jgi:hypothetical protein
MTEKELRELDKDVEEMRLDMEKTLPEEDKNPRENPRFAGFYLAFSKEMREEAGFINEDIKFLSGAAKHKNIRQACKKGINVLLKQKEDWLCREKYYQNIGKRLLAKSKNAPKEESQSSQQD